MKDILKFTIAILIAMSIHSHWMRDKKSPPPQKPVVSAPANHRCPIDTAACKICYKKSALSGEVKSTKKEVVLFPKEGQALAENQVSIKTSEGKEEFRKQMGWLIDICDEYALKEYQKRNGIVR